MKKFYFLILFAGAKFHASAQFTAGNLIVSRIGDGTNSSLVTSSSNSPISLYEFSPTVPNQAVGAAKVVFNTTGVDRFTIRPSALISGFLTLAGNKKSITLHGYDSPINESVSSSTTKILASVGQAATVSFPIKSETFLFGNGVTNDGLKYWIAVSSGNTTSYMGYSEPGTVTAPTKISDKSPDVLSIVNGSLFGLRLADGIYSYNNSDGLPSTETPASKVVSFSNNAFGISYVFFDLDANIGWGSTGLDVLYVAGYLNGLEKYYWDGVDWKAVNSHSYLKIDITSVLTPK